MFRAKLQKNSQRNKIDPKQQGCVNDFCSYIMNFLCDFPQRPLLRLRGLCAGSDLDVLYYPVFFPSSKDQGTLLYVFFF
jgi:hypothetical protein